MHYSSSAKWNAIIMIVLAAILVLGIVYAAKVLNNMAPYVPQDFTTTRTQASKTSDNIVSLSSASISNLNAISADYNAGKYTSALDMAIQEVNHNNDVRDQASALSSELGTMAGDLSQIRPASAEQIGVQAIGKEYQIIENLVNYISLTYQLLDQLKLGYIVPNRTASSTEQFNSRLNDLVSKLNGYAQSVNSLNQDYLGLMAQFDGLTK